MLLHISSLPSPHGVGDLGPGAYRFVDFLAEAKQGFWQILPLGPTDPAHGNSPYLSSSAFAGNPLFISLELLKEEGLLSKADLREMHTFPAEGVDYPRVLASKAPLLDRAWQAFKGGRLPWDYKAFVESNSYWLQDYCLFKALKARFGGLPWNRWPAALRCRERDALEEAQQQLSEEVEREAFLQYLFFKQWRALKAYCESKGVQVIGDLPIYVTQDSADVWAHPEIFKLDGEGRPQVVAGVPPDYFSRTGQRWGNPLYRWEELQRRRYDWWVERMRHNLGLFDLIRVDHFRGFLAYWEIPAGDRDARRGRWVEAPAEDFFEELQRRFPVLPIIAEDLGVITPDVREVMARFGFPGMKILQFAFGEDFPRSPYLPHNFPKAKIFMGDAGSLFIGFVIASLSIVGSWTTAEGWVPQRFKLSLAIPMLVLIYPIFDTALVTITRIIRGRPISLGGKDHSSHRLVRMGLGPADTVLLIYTFSSFCGFSALFLTMIYYEQAMLMLAFLALFIVLVGLRLARIPIDD